MAINSFNVSYPDFELGQIINPDEFDINNADTMIRVNQIIDTLNQITDGIGGDGASIVHVGDVAPFTTNVLQELLEELTTKLTSTEPGDGSQWIGSEPLTGLVGSTVHEQIESLRDLHNDLQEQHSTDHVETNDRIDANEIEISDIDTRTANNADTILQKADRSDVYTKSDADTLLNDLENKISAEFYDKPETDNLLSNKTDVSGDFQGTWQGVAYEDFFDAFGMNGMAISTTRPTNPSEKLLWFNPSNNQYEIYLNGQWRVNGTPMKIVKQTVRVVTSEETGTVSHGITEFDPEYDAMLVMQNSTFAMETYDYDLSTDGTAIEHPTGTWDADTTFDFVAFVSTPVTE